MRYLKPSEPNQQGSVIFDVRSEELFNDPRRLIQCMDETATREVKSYPADTGELHWQMIVGEGKAELKLRWRGKVKSIADDWRLYDRYKRLLQKPRRDFDGGFRVRAWGGCAKA